ncbi:HD domain-containing protein [Candidatus Avoscillospira sp. LCP25S3_F1]|uniref:HD domain-containing protein n=1 Tax=Candidatus Avoscillospira sp. LCP25S3_F1 TaxID=3438825 RepID=UPI003F915391
MNRTEFIDLLTLKMMEFNREDPKRIQHFMKVHRFAQMIGQMEHLDDHTQFVTECAALVHDIGIRPAEEKYGSSSGKLQEQEGPTHARRMLEELCLNEAEITRICYLVAHHHTYTNIDGLDYQILVEADFLVNFYEDSLEQDAIQSAVEKIFRTSAGKTLCRLSYLGGDR